VTDFHQPSGLANNSAYSTVSIIIPMLNEISELHRLKESIERLTPKPLETLIVDGGSDDGSTELARTLGFKVFEHPIANRASQINAGFNHASGTMICILHADSKLPSDAINVMQ